MIIHCRCAFIAAIKGEEENEKQEKIGSKAGQLPKQMNSKKRETLTIKIKQYLN